jgi:transcriptional regulator with XRE-family HTH domain
MKDQMVNLGAKIRYYRERKKVTLNELAKLTGIAASNLSSIELDKSSPTLSTLVKIAAAFGVKVGAFLDEALYRKAVLCRGEAVTEEDLHAQVLSALLTHAVALNKMDAHVLTMKPGTHETALGGEGTDRLVYCLEGEVTAQVGDEIFFLKKGEALYLLPEASSMLTQTGRTESMLLVVTTPPCKELPY